MAKYKMKPMIVEALNFDELMQYGLTKTENVYNGLPWSFDYMGIPITHETDDCYVIGGKIKFTKNQMLIIKEDEISVTDTDVFDIISEPLEG